MELLFKDKLSHMPFLTNFGGGQNYLFFCNSDGAITTKRNNVDLFAQEESYYNVTYVPWKMHWHDLNPSSLPERIETGFPEESVECSPAVYFKDNLFHLTFIGGLWDKTHSFISYHLYKMTGPDLRSFGPPKLISNMPSRFGFYNTKYLAFEDIWGLVKIKDAVTGDKMMMSVPLAKTNRLSYTSDDHSKMIASGVVDNIDRSYLLDLDSLEFKEIVSSKGPVYKCTILGPDIIFAAKPVNGEYEERRLYRDTYSLIDTTENFEIYYKDWTESKTLLDENAAVVTKISKINKLWRTVRRSHYARLNR